MKTKTMTSVVAILSVLATAGQADVVTYATGAGGNAVAVLEELVAPWEDATGHTVEIVTMPASSTDQFGQYRLWLAAENGDIDLYQTDVIWAPQLADHFVDLTDAASDLAPLHFPSIIESQTVNGKLVALPLMTDAPALYYRTDLLEGYGYDAPSTWEEMTAIAQEIQDAEREAGNDDLWGFVWQGNAYEGLTCNGLEFVSSFGGGQIVEPDGTISINNPNAAAAIELAAGWVGTISPEGVLAYQEEDARGIWQAGNAVFMRNWPYAYGLGNDDSSAVQGLFDVVTLPTGGDHTVSAATLGGWNVAVSQYSDNQDIAISLALYLSGEEAQRTRTLIASTLPTIVSLYDDAEIGEALPIIPRWKDVFLQAVPRPSAPTKGSYNEVSSLFWTAVHNTLSGQGSAEENLEVLEADLTDLRGDSW